jgi:hypothetical protein
MRPQPLGPGRRGQNHTGTRQKGAPAAIQIVGVMVVAQQNRIDPPERLWIERRADRFVQRVERRGICLSGRVERRVGEQPHVAKFEQDRGPATIGRSQRGCHHVSSMCRISVSIGIAAAAV